MALASHLQSDSHAQIALIINCRRIQPGRAHAMALSPRSRSRPRLQQRWWPCFGRPFCESSFEVLCMCSTAVLSETPDVTLSGIVLEAWHSIRQTLGSGGAAAAARPAAARLKLPPQHPSAPPHSHSYLARKPLSASSASTYNAPDRLDLPEQALSAICASPRPLQTAQDISPLMLR